MARQNNWRWCHKCQALFFSGNPSQGVCPSGGSHDASQSGHYAMLFGDQVPRTQGGWRWCQKCQGLFFSGNPAQGPCPAGGNHDSTQSGQYGVPWERPTKNKAIYATERVGVNAGNRFSQVGLFGIHSSDRAMNHKVWDGNEWLPSKTDWLSLGGAFDSIPAAALDYVQSFTAPPYLVFGLGTDDQAYQARVVPNFQSPWPPSFQDWQPIGGVFKSPLIVQWWGVLPGGTQSGENPDTGWALIGLGTDNQPYLKARNPTDGSTTDWQPLGGRLIYEPAIAYSDPANTFDIFGVGTDAQMYHMVFDGSQWPPTTTAWEPLGGCFTSAPAAVKWSSNRIDIFGLGSDTQMYHKWWDGAAWGPSPSDWEALGGLFGSSPAAVSVGANRLDIFALGTDDQMYHKW
jgi:hypothetical protein